MTENSDVQQIASAAREQLELILRDPGFRSSRRSAQFLKYVVEKTLDGEADQIKERTIGVDVFGRKPSYDTNEDHVVRTAAGELRKRLAIYYSDERHRTELRMSLVPGSYIPQFTYPTHNHESTTHESFEDFDLARVGGISRGEHSGTEISSHPEPTTNTRKRLLVISAVVATALVGGVLGYRWFGPTSAQDLFWKPVIDTPAPSFLR